MKRSLSPTPVFLTVLVAAALAITGRVDAPSTEHRGADRAEAPPELPPSQSANVPRLVQGTPTVAELATLTDRPLFVEGRSLRTVLPDATAAVEPPASPPPTTSVPDEVVAETERPNFRLVGVIEFDERVSALVEVEPGGRQEWVFQNDVVDGWQLTEISFDAVSFERAGRDFRFKLYE